MIPVPDSVLAELSWHMSNYPLGHDGLVFTDEKRDGIRRGALGHIWRRAAIKAKATTKRVPHDLRHFAASVLIHQGASVVAVQHHLGHANPTTTLNTYAHLWPNGDDLTRAALEAGLAPIVLSTGYDEVEIEVA